MVPAESTEDIKPQEPPPIPRSESTEDLGFKRLPMVSWFNPIHLLAIAARVVISTILGNYADKREIQAALNQSKQFTYADKGELWFDYVADLGDGWQSTLTVAKILASKKISASKPEGQPYITERGHFLVMGGMRFTQRPHGTCIATAHWALIEQRFLGLKKTPLTYTLCPGITTGMTA